MICFCKRCGDCHEGGSSKEGLCTKLAHRVAYWLLGKREYGRTMVEGFREAGD